MGKKEEEAFVDTFKSVVEKKQEDVVNHPSHYTYGKVELIDLIESLPFLDGNAIKYIYRHNHKNGVEDLRKSIWYIKRIMKSVYGVEE